MTTFLSTASVRSGGARFTRVVAMLVLAGSAHALTFISPMGEPFRSKPGDTPPEDIWFERADADHDGKITRAEFMADAGRFFRALDLNHNAEIGPEEIEHYEEYMAPEVRTGGFDLPVPGGGHHSGSRHGGVRRGANDDEGRPSSDGPSPPQRYDATNEGAARYSYLDLPEPVAAADINFDRAISPREFVEAAHQRFDALDANHDGILTRDELPRLGGAHPGHAPQARGGGQRPPREGDGGVR